MLQIAIEAIEANVGTETGALDASCIRDLSDLELSEIGGGTDITNGF
jgi:hypothetical protein